MLLPRQTLRLALPILLLSAPAAAQDRLRTMPGYQQFARLGAQIQTSVRSGALQVTWTDSGKALEYTRDGRRYRYAIATRQLTEVGPATAANGGRGGRGGGGGPARGRQFETADAPGGTWRAVHRDRNLWITAPDGSNPVAVTSDGSASGRIKYGTASWVYGEELNQTTAMWWSPDGTRLAYYRFDESPVPDYYLQLSQTKLQSTVDTEAYPKAGVPNPVVDLFVYDVAARQSTRIDVRDGKPFADDVVGHYVYRVAWTPDGRELTIHRTNRRQNVLEFAACSPATGKCRTVVRDEWAASWVDNTPTLRYLADGRRFIWESERTGWRNFYLYDLDGRLLATLTNHPFEVAGIVHVDEKAGVLYYTARDGDNHMKLQLHRVGLDGRNDRRLTDPAANHTVSLSPDGRHFVDVAQTHDRPPVTRLLDIQGKVVADLAASDLSKFDSLGLKRVELFTFRAADSTTVLHGMLHKPSNFDSTRKYPVLVSVYGGPATNGAREVFSTPSPLTEYGFLVVTLDSRSAAGRGKRFLDAIYQKLGTVEIDDQAAGVKALWSRPYVDRTRVGIYGTSYGGYASAMAIVRHPDVFAAASAASPVTDWRHYDTIYTERYMWTPEGNKQGYDAGSVMTYVNDLKGRLMIYYGTADNNVHPSNSMQLIQALQRAQKSFDVQVGPDAGHSGLNQQRMMEFFIESLVLRPTATVQ
jgi:dipeptidyl-peptidase-4